MTQDKHIHIHIEHDTALVTDTGGIVCNQVCSPEWAEYITHACNNHYQLAEALEEIERAALSGSQDGVSSVVMQSILNRIAFASRQALSNAKGDIDPAA